VLKAVSRALRKVRALGLEAKMARKGPLWEAWSKFKDVAEERLTFLSRVGDTQDRHQACYNIDVRLSPLFLCFSLIVHSAARRIHTIPF
jgi:hypothetical protein